MLKKLLLFASLQVVDKDSEEAKIIKQYVKNTHAATHNAYDLKVVDVSWAILGFNFVKMDSSKLTYWFAVSVYSWVAFPVSFLEGIL